MKRIVENNGYKTKQREAILSYLKKCESGHVTIDDVSEYLKESGEKVGRTTVYRYMEKLTQQGVLRKYFIEEGAGACYQYIDEQEKCWEHFHLKCLQCGKLLHVQCEYLSNIEQHILEHHDFSVDNTKTVFYGLCGECRQKWGKDL